MGDAWSSQMIATLVELRWRPRDRCGPFLASAEANRGDKRK